MNTGPSIEATANAQAAQGIDERRIADIATTFGRTLSWSSCLEIDGGDAGIWELVDERYPGVTPWYDARSREWKVDVHLIADLTANEWVSMAFHRGSSSELAKRLNESR